MACTRTAEVASASAGAARGVESLPLGLPVPVPIVRLMSCIYGLPVGDSGVEPGGVVNGVCIIPYDPAMSVKCCSRPWAQ